MDVKATRFRDMDWIHVDQDICEDILQSSYIHHSSRKGHRSMQYLRYCYVLVTRHGIQISIWSY
jgi:predicted nucleotidyltransferase